MEQPVGAALHHFDYEHQPYDFYTAACGTGTSAYYHQNEQHHAADRRPGVEISCAVSCCGYDGADLEERVPEGVSDTGIHFVYQQHHGYKQRAAGHYAYVSAELGIAEHLARLSRKQVMVKPEVDASRHHEHGDDHLHICAAVEAYAFGVSRKSSGAYRTEGVSGSLEKVQTAEHQENDLKERHTDVDGVELPGGIVSGEADLVHGRTGGLGPHDLLAADAEHRKERYSKHQNAHAAQPVGEAAPEQYTF